jgi:GNAT superfamily N-acetyltransferase
MALERWTDDPAHAADVAALCDVALPGEDLTEDDLAACLWDGAAGDPFVVLASDDGAGVAAGVVHDVGDGGGVRVGFVQLVAVAPVARRTGLGRELVDGLVSWAFDEHDCRAVAVGGASPFYLWPGVDVHATAALCLFEAAGFRPRGCEVNMSFPTSHRAAAPAGVTIRRALEEDDVAAGLAFVGTHWPNWVAECRRAIEHGSCHLAWADDAGPAASGAASPAASGAAGGSAAGVAGPVVVGFGCHSVNRLGWLGPMGTDPVQRHGGVGNALLSAIATDLMAAGLSSVEVAWVGPVGFYANAAAATVSRTFRTLSLSRRSRA